MMALDNFMYGGDYNSLITYEGYSEYTITDIILNEMAIGGHNLVAELESHVGKYCHILLDFE